MCNCTSDQTLVIQTSTGILVFHETVSIQVPAAEGFYLPEAPYHLQQGDILQAVPIITAPASRDLLVLRTPGTRQYRYPLGRSPVEPVPQTLLGDAFDEPESIAVVAQRVPAIILTPTCDLEKRTVWLFSPLKELPVEKKADIFAGKALSLFPICAIPEAGIPGSVIDVGDLRPVHRDAVAADLRIKSMSPEAVNALAELMVRAHGRVWGYAADELVPTDGFYGCARDAAHYGLKFDPKPIQLKRG